MERFHTTPVVEDLLDNMMKCRRNQSFTNAIFDPVVAQSNRRCMSRIIDFSPQYHRSPADNRKCDEFWRGKM